MSGFTKIDSDDLEFGDVVSFEVATLLKNNIDLLSIAVPVGEIAPILVGIPGVPTPDPNVWQECNGSEITLAASPLRTIGDQQRFTPDMRERYVKVPNNFGNSGLPGGLNNTYIFRHNHGGITGAHSSPEVGDSGDNRRMAARVHAHTIAYSFDFPVNIEPPHITIKWFMRIQ